MRVSPSDFTIARLLGEPKGTPAAMPEVQDPGTSSRLHLLATLHADKSTDSISGELCSAGGLSSSVDDSEATRDDGEEDGRCSRCKGQLSEDHGSGVRFCRTSRTGKDKLCPLCQRRTCFSPRSLSFASEPSRRKLPLWSQLTSTSLLGPLNESRDKNPEEAQCSQSPAAEEDPDFLFVRKSLRFMERRNALCEPERMLISQELRERLERDVERRRRSLVRRFSRFFTVRLDIRTEEDLF